MLEKTQLQNVYPVEQLGDTIVMTPAGDAAGFSLTAVHAEMQTLIARLKEMPGVNLVIDLSRANYFGSVIIGQIVGFGQAVRQNGGRIALCGASRDMQDVLRIMKLDMMWEMYADRGQALATIATIPVKQQVWLKRYWLYALAAMFALLLAYYAPSLIPNNDSEYYREAATLWDDVQKMQGGKVSEEKWAKFLGEFQPRAKVLADRLDKAANLDRPALRHLLWGVRDYLPRSLGQRCRPEDYNTQMFVYELECARVTLQGRDASEVKVPEKATNKTSKSSAK